METTGTMETTKTTEILVIGSRPPAYHEALTRMRLTYDAVLDPAENPRPLDASPRNVHWRPYMSDPESVLGVPGLKKYAGVFAFTDHGVLAAALANTMVGRQATSLTGVLNTRNKYLMRAALREEGIAQPAFGLVGVDRPSPGDYPLIVKPLNGTGSHGVRHVGSPAAYSGIHPDAELMWESYIDGPQFTVEGISDGTGHRALAVTGKVLSGPPHFVVLEHDTPADIDKASAQRLIGYASRCLSALGVTHAATHTELALHGDQPMLIETHTRPAGDLVPYITRLTTGWDQYELALQSCIPDAPQAVRHPARARFARTVHLTPFDSLAISLAEPRWLDAFDDVVFHDFSRVRTPPTSRYGTAGDPRWGRVVITGDDREKLAATSREIRALSRTVPPHS